MTNSVSLDLPDVGLRKRLGYVGSRLKTIGSWTQGSCTSSDCDVVIQFPKSAVPFTIDWFYTTVTKSGTGLAITVCRHESTGLTNMLCSCSFQGSVKSFLLYTVEL